MTIGQQDRLIVRATYRRQVPAGGKNHPIPLRTRSPGSVCAN